MDKARATIIDQYKVEAFLASREINTHCYLIYGTDLGAVHILTNKIVDSFFVSDNEKSYGLTRLAHKQISQNTELLGNFFIEKSLFSIKQLMIIEECGENLSQDILEIIRKNHAVKDRAVIFSAGEIRKSSKTIKNIESINRALIVPCYKPDRNQIISIMQNWLRKRERQYEYNALVKLANILPPDRLAIEKELEKLLLYCNDKRIDIAVVNEVFGCYDGVASLEEAAYSLLTSDISNFIRKVEYLLGSGINALMLLRAIQNYLSRIKRVQDLISRGKDMQAALATLNPPVFFKEKTRFENIVRNISGEIIDKALVRALLIEKEIKTSNIQNHDCFVTQSLICITDQ
jgi:DNA polymerase-3 subunit delta